MWKQEGEQDEHITNRALSTLQNYAQMCDEFLVSRRDRGHFSMRCFAAGNKNP